MIRLFYNKYTDPVDRRNDELRLCEAMNKECPLVYVHDMEGRPTFREMFEYANSVSNPGDIAVFINSDCHVDDTIIHAATMGDDECYALSRWDAHESHPRTLFDREDSQDAWICKTPIKHVPDCDFTLGTAGCDNAIAERLQRAGYKVTNPSKTIKITHIHFSNVRRHGWKNSINRPYLYLKPTEL